MKTWKVWGETRDVLEKNNVSMHRISIKPGGYCSKHKHAHKHNAFFCEHGEIEIYAWKAYGVGRTVLRAGEMCSIPPGEYHRFNNASDMTSVVYEIYWIELTEDIERESVGGINGGKCNCTVGHVGCEGSPVLEENKLEACPDAGP